MDNISEIQGWLAKREIEEKIPDKAKDRVLRGMAENVKNTKALRSGPCGFCSKEDEKLLPVNMKVCRNCYEALNSKGKFLKLVKSVFEKLSCELCFGKAFRAFTISAGICRSCAFRIGQNYRGLHAE